MDTDARALVFCHCDATLEFKTEVYHSTLPRGPSTTRWPLSHWMDACIGMDQNGQWACKTIKFLVGMLEKVGLGDEHIRMSQWADATEWAQLHENERTATNTLMEYHPEYSCTTDALFALSAGLRCAKLKYKGWRSAG